MGRSRITLASAKQTAAVGQTLASELPPGTVLALSGPLGAGKTTFVQGLAQGLDIHSPVVSPTFVFLNPYEQGRLPLFHFDLYRLERKEDFIGLGFEEYFDRGGICAIEWPERIPSLLPPRTILCCFAYSEKKGRELTIQTDDRSFAFLKDLLGSCSNPI